MIFFALLESGVGGLHAVNERVATAFRDHKMAQSRSWRFALTAAILCGSVFVAGRYGLVALVARGYAWLSWGFLVVYVLPIITIGLARVIKVSQLDSGSQEIRQA